MEHYEKIGSIPESLELSQATIEKMGEIHPIETPEVLSSEDLPQPYEFNHENYEISFLGDSITETRDRKASSLESDLYYKNIHIYGYSEFDTDHGGFDRATGNKIHEAINKARGEGRISDYTYKELMDKLDKACYYQ